MTHPDGTKWRYRRDIAGRVTARVLERADGSVEDTEAFTYDIVGNPLTAENAAVKITSEFDLRDRETKRTTLFKRTGVTRELNFAFDSMGRRQAMGDSHGRVVVYEYDRLSRPLTMTLLEPPPVAALTPAPFQSRTYTFTWDPTSNLKQVDYPNGTRTRREFDDANRLTKLVNERVPTNGAPAVLSSFVYERDQNGNITKIVDHRGQTFNYQYSTRNELTRAEMPQSLAKRLRAQDEAAANGKECDDDDDEDDDERRLLRTAAIEYRFDPAGNRSQVTNEGRVVLSSFSPANELVSRDGVSYKHDVRGNLVEKTLRSGARELFGYDIANRQVTFATAAPDKKGKSKSPEKQVERYTYDPFNQRVGVDDVQGKKLTQFHWESGRPIEEWREVGRTASGPRDKGILYLRMAGQLLEQMKFQGIAPRCDPDRDDDDDDNSSGSKNLEHLRWVMPDHLGSTSVLANSKGSRLGKTFEYGPWGEALAGSQNRSRFTYTGHQFDGASGNYYSVHRYLDPRAGRWTQRDPLGDHDGLNRYHYVHGNPFTGVDPSGLASIPPGFAAGVKTLITRILPWLAAAEAACGLATVLYSTDAWAAKDSRDLWAHCVVGCRLAKSCGGSFAAATAGYLWEEVGRHFDPNNANSEWRPEHEQRDYEATKAGADCSYNQDCAAFCTAYGKGQPRW